MPTRLSPLLLPILALAAVVAAVAGNTLANGFVWDDFPFIVFNPVYREFDQRRIFLTLGNGVEYLPVRDLSLALDFRLWGYSSAGFHLTNVFLYWLNAVGVFLVAGELGRLLDRSAVAEAEGRRVAFATALLFVLHPIHSEVVSFITCRNALLSGLFFFLSLFLYLRWLAREEGGWHLYAGAFVSFLLSLFAKATGIILPLVLLLCTLVGGTGSPARRRGGPIPFFLLSLGGFFLFTAIAARTNIMRRALLEPGQEGLVAKGAVALQIPFFYLGKLLLPLRLGPEYAVSFATSPAAPAVLASLALLLALAWLCWRRRGDHPDWGVALGWYLIALLPALNLFPTHPVVADRYAYLPSFALFFLLARSLPAALRPGRRTWPLYLLAVVALSWGVLTIRQNRVWENAGSLWSHAVAVSPRSYKAHDNLGRAYYDVGDLDAAFEHFLRAQEINPRDPEYDHFWGERFSAQGEYGRAIAAFRRAVARDPDFPDSLYQLGRSYEITGERELAVESYRRVLRATELDLGNYRQMAAEGLARLGAPP